MNPEDIIIEPLLTEKSNTMKEFHKYVFKVARSANKIEIKRALKALYKVQALDCRTIRMQGKVKRQGRFVGKTSSWKKAIVTLKKGDAIALFEGS